MDRDVYAEAGHVTCDEAREILSRFIASHFDGRMGAPTGEHARISIPANPRRDDDLRLEAFIRRVDRMERELDAVRAVRDELAERLARCEVALHEATRKADDHRRQRDEARRLSRITDEELEMIGRAMPGVEGGEP